MSRRPDPAGCLPRAAVWIGLALLDPGCNAREVKVDPNYVYGQWAAEWPSMSGETIGGVSCWNNSSWFAYEGQPLGVACQRLQLTVWSVDATATDVGPRPGEYGVNIEYATHDCLLPWPAAGVSEYSTNAVHSGVWGTDEHWPAAPPGSIHMGWYWADDYRRRLLTCRLESADVLVCTEIEDSYGPNFVHRDEQFRFQRVPALNEPMLCDRVFEEALLMGGLEYPMLGDW